MKHSDKASAPEAPFARTLWTLAPAAVILACQAYLSIPLMPYLADAWHVTQEASAWATSAFAIAFACGSLLAAPLTRWLGRRATIAWSFAVLAAFTAIMPLTGDLLSGSVVRALQGLAAGVVPPVVYVYFGERLPGERLAVGITIFSSCLSGCLVIGQMAGQLLAPAAGWDSVFWISAPLLAVAAVLIYKVMLPDALPPASHETGRSTAAAPRLGRLLPLFLSALVVLGGITAAYTAVQLYGPEQLVGDANAILALRAGALPALIASVLLAPALSRIGAGRRAAGALVLAALGMAAAGLAHDSVIGLGAALFVTMLAATTAGPALIQAVGTAAGASRATALAVYGFLLNLGAGLGAQVPQLFGQFTGVALCVAVGFGVAALLVGFLASSSAGTGRTRTARQSVPAEQAPTTTRA
ncbi:MFS transporter [Streptomyces sp. bgisy034]|uniref:MFS transporter n=1 Tax=Streptomyces sp. bgisy034 TaxID=3413774 RepID=UPI003EBC9CCC